MLLRPFPEDWSGHYDVVVTNPPFAKWEEDKIDKQFLIRKYFGNQIGLAKHIRLETLHGGACLAYPKRPGTGCHYHYGAYLF